jgi:hypothetical protein
VRLDFIKPNAHRGRIFREIAQPELSENPRGVAARLCSKNIIHEHRSRGGLAAQGAAHRLRGTCGEPRERRRMMLMPHPCRHSSCAGIPDKGQQAA